MVHDDAAHDTQILNDFAHCNIVAGCNYRLRISRLLFGAQIPNRKLCAGQLPKQLSLNFIFYIFDDFCRRLQTF